MEGRGDCRFGLGYVSNYAASMSMRSPNHVEMPNPRPFGSKRIYSVHMVGQLDQRPAYADRVALLQSTGPIPSPYIITKRKSGNKIHKTLRDCNHTGDSDRCLVPNSSRSTTQMAHELSNYTMCLRGDTLGSDRWIQGMSVGTALIQVTDNKKRALSWLPFPDVVPWQDIVITIDRATYLKDPAKSVRHVMETTTEERLLELQHLSLYYYADVDWSAHHSRMLENMIREAVTVSCRKRKRQGR